MSNTQDRTGAEIKPPLSRRLIPISVIGFCVVAYGLSTQFDRVPPVLKRGIQPADFPQLVIGLMAFLSVLLIVMDKDYELKRMTGVVWASMAMLVGFGLVAELDLFLAIGLFAGSLAILWGERRIWAIVVVSMIIPVCVFFLFDGLFDVRFPRGILTNFWYE